jgi:ribosomal-protein-alanine N-acetyltransferase
MIETERLRLIPATVAMARAEMTDRAEFARLLAAEIPDNWPPESQADALDFFLGLIENAPQHLGWFAWHVLRRESADAPATLVAGAGFLGPPVDGVVETGYSVLPQFQRQGIGTEVVGALVQWALTHPEVERVTAQTARDNTPSLRLLARLGFVAVGDGTEPNCTCFERRR